MAPRKETPLTVTWRLQQLDRGSSASFLAPEPARGRRPSSGPAPLLPRGPSGMVVLGRGANLRSVLITCGTSGTNYSSQNASRGEPPLGVFFFFVFCFFFPFQAPGKSDCEVRFLPCLFGFFFFLPLFSRASKGWF